MNAKLSKIHWISGSILTVFIIVHLTNHSASIFGRQAHLEFMEAVRPYYRNVFAETILILAAMVQIYSGVQLVKKYKGVRKNLYDKLRIYAGVYLALFLAIHILTIYTYRLLLHIDTNFDFAAPVYNLFPMLLFFIPYYTLAILAFFLHLAVTHLHKAQHYFSSPIVRRQSTIIMGVGVAVSILILLGFTDFFKGRENTEEFKKIEWLNK